MKKPMSKLIALALATVMAVSCLTGCGEKKGNGNAGGNEGGSNLIESKLGFEGEENEFGWVKPKETLEINVYAGYGDMDELLKDEKGGKATFDKWLLDNMNVKINWQYYSVDMDEKLNLMLASGDYPEVITWMSDDMANKFIAQGKALDITDYVDKFGGNITRRMGNYYNMLRSDDGRVYKLAQYWGENPNVAGLDFGARYDYWLELGDSKIYETLDEYYDAMSRILANHPTNDAGQKTYAFSSADKAGKNLLNAPLGAYGFVNGYKKNADGSMTHWLNTEEGLKVAKFINKCWREGLIDPDFLSNGYEEYTTMMTNGQLLGNMGTWWYAWTGGHQAWAVSEGDDYDVKERFMNVSVHGDGVKMDETSLLTSNYIGTTRCIITDKCKDPEAVIRYINWENSELGNYIVGWGAPSENNVWHIAEDGTWVVNDEILDVDIKETTYHAIKEANGGELYAIATNLNWLKSDGRSDFSHIDPRVDRVSFYDYWPVDPETGAFSNEGVNICWQYYTAPALDTTLYTTTFNPDDEITITKQTIEDKIWQEWAKMISAESEEACVAAFENAKSAMNALGLADLEKYYAESYKANLESYEGK